MRPKRPASEHWVQSRPLEGSRQALIQVVSCAVCWISYDHVWWCSKVSLGLKWSNILRPYFFAVPPWRCEPFGHLVHLTPCPKELLYMINKTWSQQGSSGDRRIRPRSDTLSMAYQSTAMHSTTRAGDARGQFIASPYVDTKKERKTWKREKKSERKRKI